MDEEMIKRLEDIERRLTNLEKSPRQKGAFNNDSMEEDIFEIDGDDIIVTRFLGQNISEKTQNIVLLTLLGYKQKSGETEVHASKLRKNVALHEVPLENFGTHIRKLIPQSIIKKGKVGSNKVTYRLTTFGESKAKRLRKEIIKDGN